jgi:hypothetical protein
LRFGHSSHSIDDGDGISHKGYPEKWQEQLVATLATHKTMTTF